MQFVLFGIFALVVLAVLAFLGSLLVGEWVSRRSTVEQALADPGVQTFDYEVPEGQDPAVLLAALHHHGLEAAGDTSGARQLVHIASHTGVEDIRERARTVIESVTETTFDDPMQFDPKPVRFEDER